MAQILDLGKIRFNWAGTYDPSSQYSYNDLVKYGPNLYAFIAVNAATGILPTVGSTWAVVVQGIDYRGVYEPSTTYYLNDIVIDGINTYIVIEQHTTGATVNALTNITKLDIIALGQEGLPNQESQTNKVLITDGSNTAWSNTLYLTKEYIGNAQGQAALDFENAGELTDAIVVLSGSSPDFTQLATVNTTNDANASNDIIAYTADGNNTDGWIDMGIASRTFDSANYGITGPHDGYVFMSAPRGTTHEITKKKIIGSTATVTTGNAHGYSNGNQIVIEGVDENFDGKHTITGTTSTTISFATTASPMSEEVLDPTGSVHKPYGNGNLVFATDSTGLQNSIIFAAGGYTSGTSQMAIKPNDMVEIHITTPASSSTEGALVVAGGAGIGESLYVGNTLNIAEQSYFGPGAEAFEASAGLTNALAVYRFDNDLAENSFAQIAFQNADSSSSTDLQLFMNNGDDNTGWIDLGIAGSTFSDPSYPITYAGDGYVFVNGKSTYRGNLVFGTGNGGTENKIIFAAGGYASGNTQMTITPDQSVKINIGTPSTSATTGAFQVVGGVGIQGDVNIAGNITFGGSGTQVSTANLAVSAPLIFTGDTSTSSTNDLGIVTEGKYSVTNIPVATVINKQLSSNVATLTTRVAHSFLAGDSAVIASIDATYNGTYTIIDVPTTTTFTYAKTNANLASTAIGQVNYTVTNKSLTSNVATLTTSGAHAMVIGTIVDIAGVDATFNGTYTITGITSTTFTYAKTAGNVSSTSSSGTATYYTSASTATVATATRTRYSALTKKASDGYWNLISNISTKPSTTVNYSQNTYGNGVDIIYDQYRLGGLTIQGSGSLYGAPYGSLTFTGDISSPAWNTTGIRHIGSSSSTLTDTTSTGTVAAAYTNTFGSNVTIAATNSTTYTDYANAYFGNPTAGTNVTMTNRWSLLTSGAVKVGSGLTVTGTATLNGSVVFGQTTGTIAVNTNKFTIDASTGNTLVAGTLDATGNFNVNTNKFNVTASTGAVAAAGLITANGGLTVPSGQTLTSSGTLTVTGGANFTGTTDVQELREQTADITLSSNVATLDWTAGNIYYIGTAASANMTFSVTNVPTDNSRVMTINVFVTQGATGYIPTTFNINSSAQTIKWAGGSAPTPTSSAGKLDIFSFTMMRTSGGSWLVFGAYSLNF
jgi:hypothetical protein